jgi:pre-60S factor REI1
MADGVAGAAAAAVGGNAADNRAVVPPQPPQPQFQEAPAGVYCSTAGVFFHDKESLAEHYRSDFHRYNLKRKVAGLPPVTKEWFEARRAQLLLQQQQQQQQQQSQSQPASASASAQAAAADAQLMLGSGGNAVPGGPLDDRVWYDPLTRRRFYSENTYVAHTRSRKYLDAVRRSGAPAPEPVVSRRPRGAAGGGAAGGPLASEAAAAAAEGGEAAAGGKKHHRRAPRGEAAAAGGYVVKPQAGTNAARLAAAEAAAAAGGGAAAVAADGTNDDDGSEWETTSMDEEEDGEGEEAEDDDNDDEAARWAEADTWDPRRSLFDARVAPTLEDNLEYMWRTYGFVVPDAEACSDPEGLLRYLGAKLAVGRVPLYARGDDAGARRFRSLHGVQRHMVDSGRCRVAYDGNEEEYEEFYDYSRVAQEAGEGEEEEGEEGGGGERMEVEVAGGGSGALAVAGGGGARRAAGEGAVAAAGGGGGSSKPLVLGTRALARYYRQRTRPDPASRDSVAAALVVARYRALGVETLAKQARREAAARARGGAGAASAARDLKKRLGVSLRANINTDLPKNVPY